jgi:hypothetical protein
MGGPVYHNRDKLNCARRDSPAGQQGGPVSGGPRVAPAGGEQSRAASLTLVGRCGGITQACQYTSPTVLRGFFLLGGLAGYLDVPRRPATCGVSKNLRQRSQADTDSWHGLLGCPFGCLTAFVRLGKPRHDLLATSVHLSWPYSTGLGLTSNGAA